MPNNLDFRRIFEIEEEKRMSNPAGNYKKFFGKCHPYIDDPYYGPEDIRASEERQEKIKKWWKDKGFHYDPHTEAK